MLLYNLVMGSGTMYYLYVKPHNDKSVVYSGLKGKNNNITVYFTGLELHNNLLERSVIWY